LSVSLTADGSVPRYHHSSGHGARADPSSRKRPGEWGSMNGDLVLLETHVRGGSNVSRKHILNASSMERVQSHTAHSTKAPYRRTGTRTFVLFSGSKERLSASTMKTIEVLDVLDWNGW
jgi:hypothetical protein